MSSTTAYKWRKAVRELQELKASVENMKIICSICGHTPTPAIKPGHWQCDCIYDSVSGKGHWNKPKLVRKT